MMKDFCILKRGHMIQFRRIIAVSTLFISQTTLAQDSTSKSLEEVIVTGQHKPQSLKNSVYQVKLINEKRIKLSGATNIQQVLNTQLGFRFSNDNTLGTTDVAINGMSGRNVKILLDGVPVLDRFDARVSLSQIDINTIEKIEIVEGPMSVSFGSDAMAGVINIITKKGNLNSLSLNMRVQEETAGKEYHALNYKGNHTQSFNISTKKNNLYFTAGITHNDFNGFGGDEYGREKTWLPKNQLLGNAKIGYKNTKLDIYYRVDGLAEKITDRNKINYETAIALDQKFITDRILHQVQSNYTINDKLTLNSFLAFTNLQRSTKTYYHDFVKNIDSIGTGDGQQDVSKLNSVSFKNTLQYTFSSKLSFQPGLDINHEKVSGDRVLGTPTIDDYAFFLSAEYKPTSKINIRPGFRLIKNSKFTAPPIIPSINTKFVLAKNVDMRLSYGVGFRAPALRELFFQFVDVNHNIVGNPNLKAETSNSLNGSLSWTVPNLKTVSLTTTLNGFYNAFREQIQLIQNANNLLQYSYYNIEKAKTKGFSIDNKINVKSLEANVGFTYTGLQRQFTEDATKIITSNFLWTPEVNANITYRLNKIKTTLGLFYKFVGVKPDLRNDPTGREPGLFPTSTSSYNLADFTITTNAHKNFTVNAGIKNIFDVSAVNSNTVISSNLSHNNSNALLVSYGRSYFVGLVFQFNKK
jgi:outer membrane receptor for ferrienterochelin and colicins